MALSEKMGMLFHVVIGIFYCISTYLDLQITTPGALLYGGRWKYLTFLNLMFQLMYFILAPLIDVVALAKGRNFSHKFIQVRDIYFAAIAFPFGVFVMATFWGIYVMDRELIFPAVLDKIIPSWLNHVLHTWCGVLIIIEAFLVKHEYPRNRVGITLLLLLGLTYMSWVLWIAHAADIWVYPFLKVMTHSAKAVFFLLCAGVMAAFYLAGKWLTVVVHSHPTKVSGDATCESQKPVKTKMKKVA